MNAMDRIHHLEHRRPSRGRSRFERAWSGAPAPDPSVTAPEPAASSSTRVSADDFSD